MRRSDLYVGSAVFIAIALAMPLAALEPIAAIGQANEKPLSVAACGAKLSALCGRAA
jgi:hypothetical protein